MIDPIRHIRKAIVDYAGFSFPVYDGIADPKADFPQVVITSISYTDNSAKHCTAYACTVEISTYNDAAVRGGNLTTDLMADSILECFGDNAFIVPNFAVMDTKFS
jgi:hypothetical protein